MNRNAGNLLQLERRPSVFARLNGARIGPFRALSLLISVVFGLLVLYPLVRVLGSLFVENGRPSIAPFTAVADMPNLGTLLRNTAVLVVSSMVLALVIGAFFAWLMERTDARLKSVVAIMPMLPLLMPPISGTIGWTFLLSANSGYINVVIRSILTHFGVHLASGPFNIYSWWGMIALFTMYQIPFAFLMIATGLRNSDPALEEASRVSGASMWSTFRRITIPVLRPNVGAAALFMIWFGLSFYSVAAVIGPQAHIDVLAVSIVNLLTFTYPAKTALAVGLSAFLVVVIGVAWYFQGRVLRSNRHAALSGKGTRSAQARLGKWRRPCQAVLVLYVLLTLALPLVAHLLVAMGGYWTTSVRWSKLDVTKIWSTLSTTTGSGSATHALGTSVELALVGATVGTLLAAMFALQLRAARSRIARVIDGIVKLPAALSAIVIGVGFVLAFSGSPFRLSDTFIILLLCYLVLFLPQATVSADAAAAQVDAQLEEASQVAGARTGQTFLRVHLPLMAPGLLAGWGLLFVWMIGELNASIMLSGTQTPVVGAYVLQIFQNGGYGTLASLSVVLTVINIVVLTLVGLVGRRRESTRVMTRALT